MTTKPPHISEVRNDHVIGSERENYYQSGNHYC
jgi:hypothetical protein